MPDSQKLVLIVQPSRLQGMIWQAVLKSQQLSVIWESPEANLAENLDQLKAAGLTLPDLLLVDMKAPNLNPYAFCRWSREQYPGLKIVLTNSGQSEISLSERQWAVNQGASDLLPGFQRENLVSGVAASVKRVLEILDEHPLNNSALISILLAMKRELDTQSSPVLEHVKQVEASVNGTRNGTSSNGKVSNGKVSTAQVAVDRPTLDSNRSSSNGKQSTVHRQDASDNAGKASDKAGKKPIVPSSKQSAEEKEPLNGKVNDPPTDPDHSSPPRRRYRGLYY